MQQWRAAFLGRRRLPRALSAFELEAFFTFTGAERRAIEQRRTPVLRSYPITPTRARADIRDAGHPAPI